MRRGERKKEEQKAKNKTKNEKSSATHVGKMTQ